MSRSRGSSIRTAVVVGACLAALAACTGSNASAGGAGDEASPGVSADDISVGYLVADSGTLSKRLGFNIINDGGYAVTSKGVQAAVDYVNANGGAGGRKMTAVIKPYDSNLDSPEYAEAQCRAFTQDSKVFAVAMEAQFQNNSRPCYQASRTIMLDLTLIAHDQTEFQSFSPYLWSPSIPALDTFVQQQLQVTQGAGWFTGTKGVKVVAPDTDVTRRVAEQIVLPYLKAQGITNSDAFYIDVSNAGTLGATTSAALNSATNQGQDRVFTIGGTRVLDVMLAVPEAESLNAKYSISSFDYPAFLVDNPGTIVGAKRSGMAGLGYSPALDMRLNSSDEVFPDPTRPTEGLCKKIIDDAGATPPETARENYRVDMQFCESTLLLKAALDKAPKDVTPNGFRDAVWGLGTTWIAATTYGSSWQPNQYAGATVVRGTLWDDNCTLTGRTAKGCFRWGTGDIALPAPAAAVAPAASQPATTP